MMVPKSQDFEQHGGVCIVCGRRTKKKKEKEGKGGRIARLILENSGGARAAVSRERPDCGRLANDRRRDSEEWPVRPHHLFFFFCGSGAGLCRPNHRRSSSFQSPPTSEGTWEQRGRLGNSRHFSVRRDRMGWMGNGNASRAAAAPGSGPFRAEASRQSPPPESSSSGSPSHNSSSASEGLPHSTAPKEGRIPLSSQLPPRCCTGCQLARECVAL